MLSLESFFGITMLYKSNLPPKDCEAFWEPQGESGKTLGDEAPTLAVWRTVGPKVEDQGQVPKRLDPSELKESRVKSHRNSVTSASLTGPNG